MTEINKNTKKTQAIINELARNRHMTDIYDAYDRPSRRKVESFREIEYRCEHTEGYNGDLHITGYNTSTYSTVYSCTKGGMSFVVKDTAENTYVVAM